MRQEDVFGEEVVLVNGEGSIQIDAAEAAPRDVFSRNCARNWSIQITTAYRSVEYQEELFQKRKSRILPMEKIPKIIGKSFTRESSRNIPQGLRWIYYPFPIARRMMVLPIQQRESGSWNTRMNLVLFCAILRRKSILPASSTSPGIIAMWERKQPKKYGSREYAWRNICRNKKTAYAAFFIPCLLLERVYFIQARPHFDNIVFWIMQIALYRYAKEFAGSIQRKRTTCYFHTGINIFNLEEVI